MDQAGIRQVFHVGILDQFLGADCGAKTAVVALFVVDHRQILGDGDGIVGTDLTAQTTAYTANGTAAGGDSALCHRVAGDDHVMTRLNRRN